MPRLSRRFSRYFSLPRRSTETPSSPSTSPRIDKSRISKPILSEQETQSLLSSAQPISHTHSHSSSSFSSQYAISDADLRALEEEKLSRRLEDAIDDILASYRGSTSTPPLPPPKDREIIIGYHVPAPMNPFADPCLSRGYAGSPDFSPTPSASSVYSSPPPSPPTISAKLERFRDTPPPAPGWEKVCFGRRTRLFGPEGFADFDGGGEGGRGMERVVGMGVDMGREGRIGGGNAGGGGMP